MLRQTTCSVFLLRSYTIVAEQQQQQQQHQQALQNPSFPLKDYNSFLCNPFSIILATEFVLGRTRPSGDMGLLATAIVVMPFTQQEVNTEPVAEASQNDLEGQLEDHTTTSISNVSIQSQSSPTTSQSAFDGYNEVSDFFHYQPSTTSLPTSGPAGSSADRKLQEQANNPSGTEDNRPPPNAPTGPAALRGAWSHSKTWVSEQAQEYAKFNKMATDLKHIGAQKTAALPQTLKEFIQYEKESLKFEQELLGRKIALIQEASRLREAAQRQAEKLSHGSEKIGAVRFRRELVEKLTSDRALLRKQLADILTSDNRSLLFCMDICWNDCYTNMDNIPYEERVEWPPLTAFKEAGDKCKLKTLQRGLPLPRQNKTREPLQMNGDGAHEETGSPSYFDKVVREDRLDFVQQHSLNDDDPITTCEIDIAKLPAITREFVEELDDEDEEDIFWDGRRIGV